MPKGPQGQWRPADPMACAAHTMKVATGEIAETYEPPPYEGTVAANRASKAGEARAASQTKKQRRELARAAAEARWSST